MHYARAVTRGLDFAKRPIRWLPLFILDLVFLALFLGFFLTALPGSIPVSAGSLAGLGLAGMTSLLVWFILNTWISIAIIEQTVREKDFHSSFRAANSLIIPVLASLVLIQLISMFLGGAAITVGWALSLIFSLFVSFVMQALVIDRKGPISAIETSFSLVRRHFVPIIAFLVILTAVTGIIFFAFGIWLFAMLMLVILQAKDSFAVGIDPMIFILALKKNLVPIAITAIFFLLGRAISTVVSFKAQTEFYLELSKLAAKKTKS